ncbi:unnamed protein product [Nezara viridula]|uniref:Uncharacterized protein n=1 Tax=Nezara viridula TaxID=85310 RepID=A0A9P0H4I8_NEZVI|nr:unnamed protein product [Nezara viridula]
MLSVKEICACAGWGCSKTVSVAQLKRRNRSRCLEPKGHEGMPQKNKPHLAVRHLHDPLTACLDADGTYICTAYNSRCYIIQKVRGLAVVTIHPPSCPIRSAYFPLPKVRPLKVVFNDFRPTLYRTPTLFLYLGPMPSHIWTQCNR